MEVVMMLHKASEREEEKSVGCTNICNYTCIDSYLPYTELTMKIMQLCEYIHMYYVCTFVCMYICIFDNDFNLQSNDCYHTWKALDYPSGVFIF